MIKFIKKLIHKWFGIEEEMDPHAELYLKDKEPDVPVYEEKPLHCETHLRFRKNCPHCLKIVGVK
jgi:hypothetical protein|tara:strand:+ start:392 stop:586 length:195 start_codon:yes stop_codon:yes gene_type:complete